MPVYDKYEAMQPRLKKFLKIYQQSSKNSLDGPVSNELESLNSKQSECSSVSHQSADSPSDKSNDTVRSSPETVDDKDERNRPVDNSEFASKWFGNTCSILFVQIESAFEFFAPSTNLSMEYSIKHQQKYICLESARRDLKNGVKP